MRLGRCITSGGDGTDKGDGAKWYANAWGVASHQGGMGQIKGMGLNGMPKLARLDAPGVLHHVIIRGIERRPG